MREQQAQQEDPIERFEVGLLMAYVTRRAVSLSFQIIVPVTSFIKLFLKLSSLFLGSSFSLSLQMRKQVCFAFNQLRSLLHFSGLSAQLIRSSCLTRSLESVKYFSVEIENEKLSIGSTLGPARLHSFLRTQNVVLRVSPEKLSFSSDLYVSLTGFLFPVSGKIGAYKKLT